MSIEPKQGEIWRVQFDPTKGDEIKKTRPAIVISVDGLQKLKLRLVVPLTGWKSSFTASPWIVKIEPSSQNGLKKLSAANPLQTRSVSVERFINRIGVLDHKSLEAVLLGLGIIIDIP